MSWIAVAIGGSALLGAGASLFGAKKQADAASDASALQQAQYQQTREDLDPWREAGLLGLNELTYRMGLTPTRTGTAGTTAPTREQFTSMAPQTGGRPLYQAFPNLAPKQSTFDQAGYDSALAAYNAQSGGQGGTQDGEYGSLLKPFSLSDFEASPAYQFNLQEGEKAINKGASARGMYYAPQTLQDIGKYSQGVASNEFQNAYSNYNNNMNNIWNRLYGLSGTGQNAAAQTGAYGANMANQVGQNMIGAGNAQAAGRVGAANAIGGGVSDAYNNYLMSQVLSQSQSPAYGI
jgi:hypothetical protein